MKYRFLLVLLVYILPIQVYAKAIIMETPFGAVTLGQAKPTDDMVKIIQPESVRPFAKTDLPGGRDIEFTNVFITNPIKHPDFSFLKNPEKFTVQGEVQILTTAVPITVDTLMLASGEKAVHAFAEIPENTKALEILPTLKDTSLGGITFKKLNFIFTSVDYKNLPNFDIKVVRKGAAKSDAKKASAAARVAVPTAETKKEKKDEHDDDALIDKLEKDLDQKLSDAGKDNKEFVEFPEHDVKSEVQKVTLKPELNLALTKGINIVGELDVLPLKDLVPALSETFFKDILFREVKFVVRGIPTLSELETMQPDISIFAKVDIRGLPLPIDIVGADVELSLSRVKFGMKVKLTTGVQLGELGTLSAGNLQLNLDFDPQKPVFSTLIKQPVFGLAGSFEIPFFKNLLITGLFQMAPKISAPTISISIVDYFKGLRLKDFILLCFLPPDFKITQLLGPVNLDGIGIPGFSSFLDGLPLPQMVFVYSPVKLDGLQFRQMLSLLNLDANLLKMFDYLNGLEIGYNITATIPSFDLKALLPVNLSGLPSIALVNLQHLENIKFSKISFALKNLPTLDVLIKRFTDLNIAGPDVNLDGLADFAKLEFLKILPFDLSEIPFTSVIKKGVLHFDIDPKVDVEIPGLGLGRISRPILSVDINIIKKTFDATLKGFVTIRNPILNMEVETEVALNFTNDGITGIGTILKPLVTVPFSSAYPGFSNISFDLSKTKFYVSNKVFFDPKLKVMINPGLALFSELPTAKLSDVLGAMLPPVIGGIKFVKGNIFVSLDVDKVKNIASPRINFTGRFDLSSLGDLTAVFAEITKAGIKLPAPDLTAIDGTISIDPIKNISIECRWGMETDLIDLIPSAVLSKFTGDFTIDKFFAGKFKNPRIKINIPMKEFKPQGFSVEILGDLPLQFPFLKEQLKLPVDFNPSGTLFLSFDSVNKMLLERILLDKDIEIPGLPKIKTPYIQFVQMPEVPEIFSILGKVDLYGYLSPAALTAVLKRSRLSFNCEVALGQPLQPFKTIDAFMGIPALPREIADITLEKAKIGFDGRPGMYKMHVYGEAKAFGFDVNADINTIINSSGPSGASVVFNLNNIQSGATALIGLIRKLLPPAYKLYEQFGALTVKLPLVGEVNAKQVIDATLNTIKLDKLGFVFASIPCTYDVDPEKGFLVTTGRPLTKATLSSGFSLFAKVKLGDIPPLPNPFGDPINPLGILFTKFSPSAYGLLTTGVSPQEWGLKVFVDSSETQLNPKTVNIPFISFSGPKEFSGFTLGQAALAAGVQFTPFSGVADIQALLTPKDQQEPLQFGANLSVSPTFILGGFTMLGKWYKPFGVDLINYVGNIAGQIYLDTTTKAAGDTASMGASGGSSPAAPCGGGLTGMAKLGDDGDPKSKEIMFAFNVTKEVYQTCFWTKLGGTYGKSELVGMLENVDKIGKAIQGGFTFLRTFIPPKPSGKKSTPITLNPEQEFSLAGPNALADMKKGESFEKTLHRGAPSSPMKFEQMLESLVTVAQKVRAPDFKLAEKIRQLPDFQFINPEFKFAPDSTQIGNLWFGRGFILSGKLKMFDKEAVVNFKLDLTGLRCSGYLSPLDLGECMGYWPGMQSFAADKFKNIALISGTEGTPGPKLDIKLDLENIATPETTISGKIKIVPLNLEGEGIASLSLKGLTLDFKPKLGLYGTHVKAKSETVEGKSVIDGTISYDVADLVQFKDQIVAKFSAITLPSPQEEIDSLMGELNEKRQKISELRGSMSSLFNQIGLR